MKEEFNFNPYGNKTTKEVLKAVNSLKFKGYTFLNERAGNKENFFIWKENNKDNYIRLCLIEKGFTNVFFWNLETSFKPFAYKHNHRKDANIKSNTFKSNDLNEYYTYFLEMVNKIKEAIK